MKNFNVLDYALYDIDSQVKMQMLLAKSFAETYYDEPWGSTELRAAIKIDLKYELYQLELEEKYELCMLYKDTIENLEYIPVNKLY